MDSAIKMILYAVGAAGFFVWAWLVMRKNASRISIGFALEAGVVCFLGFLNQVNISIDSELLYLFLYAVVLLFVAGCGLCGIFLIVNGISCVKKEGLCTAHILPLAFGILMALICAQQIHDMLGYMSGSEFYVFVMSALFYMSTLFPFALGGFFLSNLLYRHRSHPQNPDYIVVLGCAIFADGTPTPLLKGRLERGLEVYHAGGMRPRFIVSGGQGSDEVISEAACMKNYLLSRGVPAEKIIEENQSTTTEENLRFSKALAEPDATFAIATSSYHTLRAKKIADKLGMHAESVGAKTAHHYAAAAFLREYIAVIFSNKPVILLYFALCILLAYPLDIF